MFIIQLLIAITVIKLAYMLYYANKGENYCKTAMKMVGCSD